MNISFDPTLKEQAQAVAAMLIGLGYAQKIGTVTVSMEGAQFTTIGTIGTGGVGGPAAEDSDDAEERSAADVFAGAAPLSDALVAAGAIPLPTVPGALPGSSTLPGSTALAQSEHSSGAPSASGAQTSAGGVELDTQGIPWHHEIHASTKSKTKSGEWTKLRGLNDEAKYNRIVAELKALQALPLQNANGAASTAVAGSSLPVSAPAGLAQLPGSLPPLQTAVAPPAKPHDFDSLMPRLTAAITAGLVPDNALTNACAARQLPGVVALIQRPDFVPTIWDDLVAAYPALA